MASITLKNIPDELLDRLRARAQRERRSLTQQAVYLLEGALHDEPATEDEVAAQVNAWRALAGRWLSTEDAAAEISAVYDARTAGRDVDL